MCLLISALVNSVRRRVDDLMSNLTSKFIVVKFVTDVLVEGERISTKTEDPIFSICSPFDATSGEFYSISTTLNVNFEISSFFKYVTSSYNLLYSLFDIQKYVSLVQFSALN